MFAMGLTLCFIVFKVPWFAHAVLVMLGAFFAYYLCFWGLNFWTAMAISMGLCALIAALIERTVVRKLYTVPHAQLLVAVFAIYMIVQYGAVAAWGVHPRAAPSFLPLIIKFAGFRVPAEHVIVLVFGAIAIFVVFLFLRKTKIGKAIRATSQDSDTASILGINVNSMRSIVFVLSGIFAGTAGSFLVALYKVDPFIADYIIMKTFIVITLGGFGSVLGAIVGGYTVGIVECLIVGYISSDLRDPILFFAIIVFLLIRPTGVFGVERRR